MTEEKKSTYTGQTDARRKASAKYLKESVEDIRIRVPKGQKEVVKSHSDKMGESMNSFVVRAINETMERDNQSSGVSQKKTPSEPVPNHPEPESHEKENFPSPPVPDHRHIDVKTEPAAPVHKSPVEKLERLRRKTMDSMANQHSKAGNGHIPMQKGEPDTQRRKPEYGSGANSHITIGGWTDMPDAHRETFEEKMERLSKSHPLKMDGVVQRQ